MQFELAKKCKDVGFPQIWATGRRYYLNDGSSVLFDEVRFAQEEDGSIIPYETRLTYIPTLSELIVMLDKDFGCLARTSNGFAAFSDFNEMWFTEQSKNRFFEEGATMIEAVAKLYISVKTRQEDDKVA